jgi:hypothetical protein
MVSSVSSFGTPVKTASVGDTFANFLSNDNKIYIMQDDGTGFTGTPNAGYNEQVGVLTNESTFAGTLVNTLSAYGGKTAYDGADSPTLSQLDNKGAGLFGMLGNLYLFTGRVDFVPAYAPYTPAYHGTIMKSTDHGATWNTSQAPSTYNAAGVEPHPITSYSSTPTVYASPSWGWVNAVRYAADDGTMGYNTAGNQIDGANAFVYVQQNWSSASYVARIPRIQFDAQNGSAFQYWIGPSSPTPADFVNDTNWRSTISVLNTPLYSNTFSGGVSANFTVATGYAGLGTVVGNYLQATANGAYGGIWNGTGAWATDQFCQLTVQAFDNSGGLYALVRSNADFSTSYYVNTAQSLGTSSQLQVRRQVANIATTIMTMSVSISAGDTIAISAVGTLLTVYHNGTVVGQVEDTAIASGYPGYIIYTPSGALTLQKLTAWAGGTISSLTATLTGYPNGYTPDIVFIPTLNSYLLSTTLVTSAAATSIVELSAPTPAGPWTVVGTWATNPAGFYGNFALHRSLVTNTASQSIPLTMLYSGDSAIPADYVLTSSTFTLGTSAYNIAGNVGVGGATVSWTGMASGSTTADTFGYYVIPNLAAGTYTITPTLTGKSFSPASVSETISAGNITGVNFALGGSGNNLVTTNNLLLTNGLIVTNSLLAPDLLGGIPDWS